MQIQITKQQVKETFATDLTKKNAQQMGVQMVKNLLDQGEVDVVKIAAYLARINEIVSSAYAEIKEHLPSEKISINGVEFTPNEGRKMPEYETDLIYAELKEKLKEREELLKTALKTKEMFFDNQGIEVPKVPIKYSKSSITVKF